MKNVIKAFNLLVSILLVFSALIVALLAFPIFGNKALIVRSGSMEPTIDVGAIIVVRPELYVGPGDIIAFRSEKNPNTIITHRIVSIERDVTGIYYKTKGDANKTVDGWRVSPKNVLGRSFVTVPYVGKLLSFARSDIGFPTLIIFPALLVIVMEIFSVIREIKKKSKKTSQTQILKQHFMPEFGFVEVRNPRPNFIGLLILLPLLILGIVAQNSFAYFSDTETSTGNFFAAAESFGTPTPTPTNTPTPTPTSTPTPTPSGGCANNNNNVTVTGGGTGSNTGAVVINNCTSSTSQSNSTTSNTTVHQSSNTGENSTINNTTGSNSTSSNTSTNSVTSTTTERSNSTSN